MYHGIEATETGTATRSVCVMTFSASTWRVSDIIYWLCDNYRLYCARVRINRTTPIRCGSSSPCFSPRSLRLVQRI
jgi:hypothetical protein